jgi:Condensation domain
MSQDNRARLKQWLSSGETRLQPVTLAQRELFEASPVPPGDVSNHICAFIHIHGMLTPQVCEAAVQRVVERQEVFRLSFLPGKGQPMQMIRHAGKPVILFRELAPAQREPQAIEELALEVFRKPFDMVSGPLYRSEVLRRAADDHVLVFAIHHGIADGWTLGVFVQDLVAAYLLGLRGVPGSLPPVPLSYTDWGAAERAFWQPAELDRRAAFWKSCLVGTRRLWDASSGVEAASGFRERWVSAVAPEVACGIRDLARRHGTTLFNTLLAAFQIAFSKWAGTDDVLVGTPVANRSRQGVRETMGYCAGIVPLRGRIDPVCPFADMLRAVHGTTLECFANAMPFVELVRALGDAAAPGHNPVFQVRFALQNHPVPDVEVASLSLRLRMRSTGTARFDLGCEITEMGEGLEVVWLFRRNLFSREDVETLDRMYQSVLAAVCRAPESRTATLMTRLL